MKNKLKMLFAYFRPLGDVITTYMALDYIRIEDWNEKFDLDDKKTIEPPKVIIDIIKELINLNEYNFNDYNYYDVDSWWYLDIIIEPKLNRLTFRSQCKIEKFNIKENENDVSHFTNLNGLLKAAKVEYGEFVRLNFTIVGRWDEYEIYDVIIDGYDFSESETIGTIGDDIMRKYHGKYWASEQGMEADISIWGDDVFVKAKDIYEDYDDTEMNLIITPDNIK